MDTPTAKKELAKDFDKLLKDAKALLSATAGEADAKTREARQKLEDSLSSAEDTYDEVVGRMQHSLADVDNFVRESPYQALGIAFVAGLIAGWITRK
jgi:ElaB/YqjD/DUF883 family membrane-anchored ribosome-binding protein